MRINVTDDNITVFLPFVHVAIFVLLVDLLLKVGTVNAHIPFVTSALIWGDTFTVLARKVADRCRGRIILNAVTL